MINRSKRKKIVIGNWKMNPQTAVEAKKIFRGITKKKIQATNVSVVVCPSFIHFPLITDLYRGNKILFGTQDISNQTEQASTGEISAKMIKSLGGKFSIIGHSERRAIGESNELIAQKVEIALKNQIHPVLCIGEQERKEDGSHLHFIEEQIRESLKLVPENKIKKVIIAYEPIWAIGTGKSAMTPEDVERTALFIRKIVASMFNKKAAEAISIIYGGSVNSDNAAEIVFDGNVDGVLPGRASLNPEEFAGIINALKK